MFAELHGCAPLTLSTQALGFGVAEVVPAYATCALVSMSIVVVRDP